jgi:hypothetical protein
VAVGATIQARKDDLVQRPEVANRIESFLRSEIETPSASRRSGCLLAILHGSRRRLADLAGI